MDFQQYKPMIQCDKECLAHELEVMDFLTKLNITIWENLVIFLESIGKTLKTFSDSKILIMTERERRRKINDEHMAQNTEYTSKLLQECNEQFKASLYGESFKKVEVLSNIHHMDPLNINVNTPPPFDFHSERGFASC
jgi:hypothetical protein